ncbi:MAG: zinc ribbon domain-containing protein [Elusimicrobia bacterium]|nr:zinc ribbon domain-containing protein [Elusimicrobiota bacterium]
MAQSKYAGIACTRCGASYPAPGYSCSKCQGSLAKICGKCGFRNSVAKNYCDRCGTQMILAPAAEDQSAPPGIPKTARRSNQPQDASKNAPSGGFSIPSARRMDGSGPAPIPQGEYVPFPAPTQGSLSRLRLRDRRQNMAFWLPGLVLAALAGYLYYDSVRPDKTARLAANEYLEALARSDFPAAYAMLSREARAQCSLEDFRSLRDQTAWTWSDVELVRLEPDAAVVKYRLKVSGKPPEDDYLFFLREKGAWARPYNWNLLRQAEAAFDRSDPDMALLVAQAAVRINPRDPMARGYLCEAVYYRKVPAETEKECALAIQLSRAYPSKLSLKSLYHLHAILGDTYKNSLAKYPEALEEYDSLLAFPNLSSSDKCDLLLARADTRAALGRAQEAGLDLTEAAAVCTRPSDLEYIRKKRSAPAAARPAGPR